MKITAVSLAAATLVTTACATDTRSTGPEPPPTTSEETTPGQASAPLPGSSPRRIVALTLHTLVVLDAEDGGVLRTVLEVDDDVFLRSLSLTPDRETAYLGRTRGDTTEVVAVELATGRLRVLGEGGSPSLSPDGTRLAYERASIDESILVVRDLAEGSERTWRWESENTIGGWYMAGWLPDSRRFLFGEIGVDPPGSLSGVVNTDEPGEVMTSSRLGRRYDGTTPWTAWEYAIPYTDDNILVAAKQGTGGPSPTRLEVVASGSFERREVLFRADEDFFALDADEDGGDLVMIGGPSMGPGKPRLFRWHGAKLIALGTGYVDASW